MNVMNVIEMHKYALFMPLVATPKASHKMLWKMLRGMKYT